MAIIHKSLIWAFFIYSIFGQNASTVEKNDQQKIVMVADPTTPLNPVVQKLKKDSNNDESYDSDIDGNDDDEVPKGESNADYEFKEMIQTLKKSLKSETQEENK